MTLKIEREVELRDIRREYVEACTRGGRDAAEFVEDAIRSIRIEFTNPAAVRQCLKGYAAWEGDELEDDAENASRMFWIICCAFSEYICEAERFGFDPYNETTPEGFEPSASSDIFVIE